MMDQFKEHTGLQLIREMRNGESEELATLCTLQ